MSLLRGAHLATYLLGAPGAAGTAAHLLTSKYLNLMNFEGNFFLVKAVSELYDSGIPQIPESIKNAVDQIVKQLQNAQQIQQRKKRSTSAQQASAPAAAAAAPKAQVKHEEVFKDKKYWCRYFDYSRGPQHVIMEYDKGCTLYNIFDIKGKDSTASPSAPKTVAVQASGAGAQSQPDANTTSSGGKVYDISAINNKEKTIDTLKLGDNKDFLKGAFYLLSLDKTKFSRLNTLTHIELTEVGSERLAEQTYQKKIATLKIKAPMKGDIKDLKLSFLDNKLPSSVLLLKKVKKPAGTQVQTTAASSSSGSSGPGASGGGSGDPNNSTRTYFLQKQDGSQAGAQVASQNLQQTDDKNKKLQVLGMWEFPPLKKGKEKISDLDLRYLDKVLWDELKNDSTRAPRNWGLLGTLLSKILRATDLGKDYEDYYVVKTLSDFWNYTIGDKVQLIETTETKAAAASAQASLTLDSTNSQSTASSGSTQDQQLAEFEVVSGLLVHLNSPIQCIPNSSTAVTELVNLSIKRNYAKKPNGVFSERNNPFYCKPADNGMPPYTMIFLGRNIEDLNKDVQSTAPKPATK